jgi:uncharacterized protein YndB with AHSA1/START domain
VPVPVGIAECDFRVFCRVLQGDQTVKAFSTLAISLVWAALIPSSVTASEPESVANLMAGKIDTGRAIEFRMVVDGSPEEVFHMWTDSAASTEFFGSSATIEPRLAGVYEIGFDTPTGERAGTTGTKILRFEPPSLLFFEWEMPKYIGHLNSRPFPTWVELRFERFGNGDQTDIHFYHRGFGDGPDWDQGFEFFQRNWFEVLFRLKQRQASVNKP